MFVAIAYLAISQAHLQPPQWERLQISALKMSLELPAIPDKMPVQIRTEAQPFIESMEAYSLTMEGVFVRASLTQYVSEFEFNMPAAINGLIAGIKKEPDVKDLTYTFKAVKMDGADGVRITARYKVKGKLLRYDAVMTNEKNTVWIVGCGFDAAVIKSLGSASRILDSFRFYKKSD